MKSTSHLPSSSLIHYYHPVLPLSRFCCLYNETLHCLYSFPASFSLGFQQARWLHHWRSRRNQLRTCHRPCGTRLSSSVRILRDPFCTSPRREPQICGACGICRVFLDQCLCLCTLHVNTPHLLELTFLGFLVPYLAFQAGFCHACGNCSFKHYHCWTRAYEYPRQRECNAQRRLSVSKCLVETSNRRVTEAGHDFHIWRSI
jgi:hypothetical protein